MTRFRNIIYRLLRYWTLFLLLPVAAAGLFGERRDICARCGAERHRWLWSVCLPDDIRATSRSQQVDAVIGGPCGQHEWFLTSGVFLLGAGDNFDIWKTPLYMTGHERLLEGLARLPTSDMRRQVWFSATDTRNRLKWAACILLQNLEEKPALALPEANAWFERNRALLTPEYDEARARAIAAPFIAALDENSQGYWFAGWELKKEMAGRK